MLPVNAQPTLWEVLLPEMCLGMPAELEAVDGMLDDAGFFEPFRAYLHTVSTTRQGFTAWPPTRNPVPTIVGTAVGTQHS